jgi:hypothetical protein
MTTPSGLDIKTEWVNTSSVTTFYLAARALQINRGDNGIEYLPEITRFAIYRSTADSLFSKHNENVTECSLFISAYEYIGAKANGSEFSFAQRRESDIGNSSSWRGHFDCGTSGGQFGEHWCTKETRNGDLVIPVFGLNIASLFALETFFTSPSIVTSWIVGNHDNSDLGVAAALSGDVDLNHRFQRMATAMSDYLRYGPNILFARGEIVQSLPFVSIRWGYFIVPIITEGFAILFAVLSIISNRKSRNIPLWKSSTLAILDCQHEEQLGLLSTTGRDLNEIEAKAMKAQARLQ